MSNEEEALVYKGFMLGILHKQNFHARNATKLLLRRKENTNIELKWLIHQLFIKLRQ